jgi:predicted transposase YdaD
MIKLAVIKIKSTRGAQNLIYILEVYQSANKTKDELYIYHGLQTLKNE